MVAAPLDTGQGQQHKSALPQSEEVLHLRFTARPELWALGYNATYTFDTDGMYLLASSAHRRMIQTNLSPI